jgi:hypothetical protein
MKLCILGAAGRTGVEVVNCARAHGFEQDNGKADCWKNSFQEETALDMR